MILAIDVYYREKDAKSVGVLFHQWEDKVAADVIITYSVNYEEYEPGAFYKRELPCILDLLKKIDLYQIDVIIIDGYIYLDNDLKAGLGLYVYQALDNKIPIIGVAKKAFHLNKEIVKLVYRGDSKNPLYVTAVGIDPEEAALSIAKMDGEYRMPTLLKLVDSYTKK